MIRYLNNSDYDFIIQGSQLNQILQVQPGLPILTNPKLIRAEMTAMEEVSSYLIQRWDISYEFTNTSTWSYTGNYGAHDRVILDYATFSSSISYATGSCVIYSDTAYMSLGVGATTSTPNVNVGNWTPIGNKNDIYYAKYPMPIYDSENYYNLNDVVYWVGKTYSCLKPTTTLSSIEALQYNRIEWLPVGNVLPNTPHNGQWSVGITYSVPVGTLPTNTNYWTRGDNRSAQMVMFVMDITLYHLHKNIAPTNIPLLRKKAYDDAINYLKRASRGDITLNFPLIQPTRGLKIRFGGDIRKNNNI